MSETKSFTVTREKHLDHLVKVVPLIVLGYAIQCFVLTKMKGPLGPSTLVFLAISLSMMIGGFVAYDLKHRVVLFEEHMVVSFYFYHSKIPYQQIHEIILSEERSTFSTVMFRTERGIFRLYFVDDADKIKEWIESRKSSSLPRAA